MSCLGKTTTGEPCRSTIGLKNRLCAVHINQYGEGMPAIQGEGMIRDAYDGARSTVGKVKDGVKRRIDAVRDGPSKKMPANVKKFLEANKGKKVVKIQLGQKPVVKPVAMFLNTISLGKYKKKIKELDYDDAIHNFILVTLDDGKTYKLEKNERVVAKPAKKSDYAKTNTLHDVPVTKDLTLPEMVENASKGREEEFYHYRGAKDNCQRFTRDMIVQNGLLGDDDERTKMQDAKAIVDTLPGGETIPNAVTDLANVIDRVKNGDGIRGGIKLRRKPNISDFI